MNLTRRTFLGRSMTTGMAGLAAGSSGFATAAEADSPTGRVALVPSRLWDGTADASEADKAVLLRAGLIESVAEIGELPSDVSRIPLDECTLLPGLIDAHVHATPWSLPGFLAAGVTTIRDVGNVLDWVLAMRERAAATPTLAPRILCCGPLMDGKDKYWPTMGQSHAGAREMAADVESLIERGVDAIKIYVRVTREQMQAAVEAAKQHGTHVLAHFGGISPLDAAKMGVDEIEHLVGCPVANRPATVEERDAFIDELLPYGLVMCPTIIVWERFGRIGDASLRRDDALRWIPKVFENAWHDSRRRGNSVESLLNMQRSIVEMKSCLNQMRERGLPVIAGTDAPWDYIVPGFSLHDELAMYVDGGFPPVAALKSATSDSARVLRIDDKVGTVRPGMVADLIAVRGDPTVDILDLANVEFVMRGGQLVDRMRLQEMADSALDTIPDDPISQELLDWNVPEKKS